MSSARARRLSKVVVIAVAILTASAGRAERLPLKTYSTADGLSNNDVLRIVADSRGFVWLCTQEGLSRFDGYGFTSYGIDDGLPSAIVNDLVETRAGAYWVATSRGLARLDPNGAPGRMFKVATSLDSRAQHVKSLLEDREGRLWLGTFGGLFVIAPGSTTATRVDLTLREQPEVFALAQDTRGGVWAGTGVGLFRRTDQRTEHYTIQHGLTDDFVSAVLVDRNGELWVGSHKDGAARFSVDPDTGRLDVVARPRRPHDLPGSWVNQIIERSDGRVVMATIGGVAEFVATGSDWQSRAYTTAHGLTTPALNAVAEDRDGHLWIGGENGAARLPPFGFTLYDRADGMPAGGQILETTEGGVVVLDIESAVPRLGRFDRSRFVPITLDRVGASTSWGAKTALRDRTGDWWIGTRNGVLRYRAVASVEALGRATPAAVYSTQSAGLASDVVIQLFEDSRGDVWIATAGEGRPNGLSRFLRAAGRFEHFQESSALPWSDVFVTSFAEDATGGVWIGLNGAAGLARFRDGAFSRYRAEAGVPAWSVRSLHVDTRRRLWVATVGGGLAYAGDPTADQPSFSTYSTSRGLSSNWVTAITDDVEGRIYAATARGIDRLDPDSGRVLSFRAGDGLPTGAIVAAYRDRRGDLWFGGIFGVIRLTPMPAKVQEPPAVLVTRLQISGEPHAISALGNSTLVPFELQSGRHLEIEFVAPGSRTVRTVRYQIKLDGSGNDAWSAPMDARTVTYANLAPGAYRFAVRAIDGDNSVSGETGFAFTVLAPIWQRWWFVALVVAAIGAAGHALYRQRLARALEIARMRARIATDLHDDIGANLTRIAVLSEVVRRQPRAAGAGIDGDLASIASVARESMTSMSDIVWAINPDRDTVGELVRRMRACASETCAEADVEVEAAAGASEVHLPAAVRRDVYLIFKEALNNVARHAGCSHVRVTLAVDGGSLELAVTDDGVGFDQDDGEGNGLASMRQRADRLGATLTIASGRARGTAVRLSVPVARGIPAWMSR